MNRKEFLNYSGPGALALGLTQSLYYTGPGPQRQLTNSSLTPTIDFNPDLVVELTAMTGFADDEIVKLN